jgi:quercetin dioxygenase-like cupin family protein
MSDLKHPVKEYDTDYKRFQEQEGIPVHTGFAIDDVRDVTVDNWRRTGCAGAFVNLYGMEGMCDIQIHEILPEQDFKPQRHLHESVTFVLSGNGISTVGAGEGQTTFEWSEGALFFIPRNTRYRHVNASEDSPVRLLSVTPLPLYYTLLQQDDAIWNIDPGSYEQWTAMSESGGENYSQITEVEIGEGMGSDSRAYWESNFVPDIGKFNELEAWPERGGGGQSAVFSLRNTNMLAHVSQFPAGRYKKAHRHHPGANVIILTGSGYSLLWQEGDESRKRIDWSPFSLFTPPLMWWHQHFNASEEPAPQLGLRGSDNGAVEPLNPANQIEYSEEDPEIRQLFRNKLRNAGVQNKMDPAIYVGDN